MPRNDLGLLETAVGRDVRVLGSVPTVSQADCGGDTMLWGREKRGLTRKLTYLEGTEQGHAQFTESRLRLCTLWCQGHGGL